MERRAVNAGESPYLLKKDQYSSHALIVDSLKRYAKAIQTERYRVLDVGCASGFLHHFLPSSYFYFTGIEQDATLAAKARQNYDEVYQADLNNNLNLPIEPPNCIVLADVLEHLPNPAEVLTNLLHCYAKPGTPVIISLPNVAHLYVRLSLLLGRFNYTDRGILDRTHLRFFTLHTARQLCETSGIRITSLRVTPVPLPLVHPIFGAGQPLFIIHAFSATLSTVFKGLLGYQFILDGIYEP